MFASQFEVIVLVFMKLEWLWHFFGGRCYKSILNLKLSLNELHFGFYYLSKDTGSKLTEKLGLTM